MKTHTRCPWCRALWLWVPPIAWMAAIFFVSGQSQPQVPGDLPNAAGHVIAYTILGVLLVRAVAGGLPLRVPGRTAGLVLAIAIGYGVSDEIHQMFVPGRTPDVMDVLADAAGAVIALGACWAWGILSNSGAPVSKPSAR